VIVDGNLSSLSSYVNTLSSGVIQWTDLPGVGIARSSGQVLIGKTSSTNALYVLDVSGAAFITDLVANSMTTFSDKRLKMNIYELSTCKSILDLNTYGFNYITRPDVVEIGFIAQEMEDIAPEIVREHNGYKSIQYDRLCVLLLPIIKKQQQEIEELKNLVSDIKGCLRN